MSKIIRLAAAVAAAVSASLLPSPPANADDRRPCVSEVEFYDTPFTVTQARLEARWEMAGLGIPGAKSNGVEVSGVLTTPGAGVSVNSEPHNPRLEAFTYRACGYSLDEAWVVAYYRRSSHQLVLSVAPHEANITLHGHR